MIVCICRVKINMRYFLYGGFFLCLILAVFIFVYELTIYRFFYLKEGTVTTIYAFDKYPVFSRTEKTKLSHWISTFSSKMPDKFILIGMRKNYNRYYIKAYGCYRELYELYLQQTIDKSSLPMQKITNVLLRYKNYLLPYPKVINHTNSYLVYLKIFGLILVGIAFLLLNYKLNNMRQFHVSGHPKCTSKGHLKMHHL